MHTTIGPLIERLRKHATLHEEHARYVRDLEQEQWASDLHEAADLIEFLLEDLK